MKIAQFLFKAAFWGFVFSVILFFIPDISQADVIYVDVNASGANNGISWSDAYVDLQSAITQATPGDDIWVAEGTYKPSVKHGGGQDRHKSFQMKNDTGIYGGFIGGETTRGQRDWTVNQTILSGDIGAVDNPADNCYHVFYHPNGINLDDTAILDGFTITGGMANSVGAHNLGGGMYNYSSSPTLRNLVFDGNATTMHGGGIYNKSSAPVLTHCTFANNTASVFGGGIYNILSTPVVNGCIFVNNSAVLDGGGMYSHNSTPILVNCVLAGNTAGRDGGAINNYNSPAVLTNCTFNRNSALNRGGGLLNHLSSPVITNCIFWEDSAPSGSEIFNTSTVSNPDVTYSDIAGGYPGTGNISADPMFADPLNGDYHLRFGSPCIDTGTSLGGPDNDFDGNARPLLASHDMGMDEFAHWYGDFNANQSIGLADPIICLQIGVGNTPTDFVFHELSDVNNDGRPGMADALFDLQVLAGIRNHPDWDRDQDGYSQRNGDCSDDDNRINPASTETCGDGIDQDCDTIDHVCTPSTTYMNETFAEGSGGFFEEWGYAVNNNNLLFQGDGSDYTSINYWNGGVNPSYTWYPQPGHSNYFDDFYVSVMTNWESGDPDYIYGLVLCLSKNSSGNADWIRFSITKSGNYMVGKIFQGEYETVIDWDQTFLLDITGQQNQIGVQKIGYNYRFFINGYEVAQAHIPDILGGAIGLVSSEKVNVSYDDYTVTDPYQGQIFIPSEGYRILTNEMIFKNMTNTYLWYDEVPNVSLEDYASAKALLKALKYHELDHWSYIVSKEEHESFFEEGKYIGVGMGIWFDASNTSLRIKYVYPSSPAAEAGLLRGDRLLSINGKTIAEIESNDLWDTIFGPDEIGVAVAANVERTGQPLFNVDMEKAWVTIQAVLHTEVIPVDAETTTGYLVFNDFIRTAMSEIDDAFNMFKSQDIDELIVDLRYNPGGLLSVARYMAENLVAPGNEGIFIKLSHNDQYRDDWDYEYSLDPPSNALGLSRLFVITTNQSCSASEALINGMSPYMEVVTLGDTTCGKPVGMHGYDIFDLHLSSIEFETKNAENIGGYFNGLDPTCAVDDDLDKPLGHTEEISLKEALHYINNGACSVLPSAAMKKVKPAMPSTLMTGFRRVIGAF